MKRSLNFLIGLEAEEVCQICQPFIARLIDGGKLCSSFGERLGGCHEPSFAKLVSFFHADVLELEFSPFIEVEQFDLCSCEQPCVFEPGRQVRGQLRL